MNELMFEIEPLEERIAPSLSVDVDVEIEIEAEFSYCN